MISLQDWTGEKLQLTLTALGWVPLPHQVPPTQPRHWWAWLLIGGRWSGKTELGSHYTNEHAMGPPCLEGPVPHRIGVIAPTHDAAVKTCVTGHTGLLRQNERLVFSPKSMGGDLQWPNGAIGTLYSAYTRETANDLRGPAHCLVWADEIAHWVHLEETVDMMRLGLRLGPWPRMIGGTTPKPRKFLVNLIREDPLVVVTQARMDDNPYASEETRAAYQARYGGTRLGRQELEGEFLFDVPGAAWTADLIEAHRVTAAPELSRVVVAIDPAMSHGETSDETGIGAVGKGLDGAYYVLADRTVRLSPEGWARRALNLLDEVGGVIVAENNAGGEMVETTIRQVRQDAPLKLIRATHSKEVRAQPVVQLYEQGKVHHVGMFEELEDQMCTFPVANEHDDRVDWLVHAITDLSRSDSRTGWGAA